MATSFPSNSPPSTLSRHEHEKIEIMDVDKLICINCSKSQCQYLFYMKCSFSFFTPFCSPRSLLVRGTIRTEHVSFLVRMSKCEKFTQRKAAVLIISVTLTHKKPLPHTPEHLKSISPPNEEDRGFKHMINLMKDVKLP